MLDRFGMIFVLRKQINEKNGVMLDRFGNNICVKNKNQKTTVKARSNIWQIYALIFN